MLRQVLLVTLACSAPALAQPAATATTPAPSPPPAVDKDKPFLFAAGHLGLNAPFGALGLELGGGVDFLRGSVSIGRGIRGISVAAMARVVHEVGFVDLGLGVGVSRGPGLHSLAPDEDTDYEVQYGAGTIWMDVEMSAELALAGSGFMRMYAGVTGARYFDCVAERAHSDVDEGCDGAQVASLQNDGFLPYVGIAGGFRWPEAPQSKPRYSPPPSPYGMFPRPMW